jgi:hypothetical protein
MESYIVVYPIECAEYKNESDYPTYWEHTEVRYTLDEAAQLAAEHRPSLLYAPCPPGFAGNCGEVFMFAHDCVICVGTWNERFSRLSDLKLYLKNYLKRDS